MMIVNTAHTKFGDIQYLENDFFIASALRNDIVWDEGLIIEHLHEHIKNAKVVLDIGAHVGCHTLIYKSINNDCSVYSFEMQSIIYELLKKNIAINHLQKVQAFHCAIGESIGMVTISDTIADGPNKNEKFAYNNGNEYNFGGVSLGPGQQEILMISIDSLQLEACDFIKIDVEGFEYFVIKGASQTMQKYKPVIFYEENYKKISQSTTELLKSMGYNSFETINEENFLAKYI
ncbi:MAG TPA: FkbM family methyltransferase [Saprospiraceae bacterium]|nr:FkbM family methyltransferase [Saprospiraceae bacterium]